MPAMTLTERTQKVLTEIDAALELAENATPGPWRCIDDANNHWGMVEVKGPRVRVLGFTQATDVSITQGITTRCDCDFIATSRTLLPASLKIIRDDIRAWLELLPLAEFVNHIPEQRLTTLCDQYEALNK